MVNDGILFCHFWIEITVSLLPAGRSPPFTERNFLNFFFSRFTRSNCTPPSFSRRHMTVQARGRRADPAGTVDVERQPRCPTPPAENRIHPRLSPTNKDPFQLGRGEPGPHGHPHIWTYISTTSRVNNFRRNGSFCYPWTYEFTVRTLEVGDRQQEGGLVRQTWTKRGVHR